MTGKENGQVDKLSSLVERHIGKVNEAISTAKIQRTELVTEFRSLSDTVTGELPLLKSNVAMNTDDIRKLGKRLVTISVVVIILLCGVFGIDKVMDLI